MTKIFDDLRDELTVKTSVDKNITNAKFGFMVSILTTLKTSVHDNFRIITALKKP